MPGALDPRTAMHASTRSARPQLRAVPPVDPEQVFGPGHAAISALIAALDRVSPEQDDAIEARWYDLRGDGRFIARGHASQAASANGRLEEQMNARQRTWSATTLKCRDAAGDAAHALAVRDLIGEVFDAKSYAELVEPWASVMGVAHPDDVR